MVVNLIWKILGNLKRTGIFFGQCSEICGVNHGFMPISVLGVQSFQFNSFILNKVEF